MPRAVGRPRRLTLSQILDTAIEMGLDGLRIADLRISRDHSDDITTDMAFEIFVKDLRARGEIFEMPSDPLHDTNFIGLLTRIYDVGRPKGVPEDPVEPRLVA